MSKNSCWKRKKTEVIADMFEKSLPIGSVVLLKGADKRLMITGYLKKLAGDDAKVYDYCGVPFPQGYVDAEAVAVFDHAQIEHIYALGFQNEIQFIFREKLEKLIAERG